MAFNPKIVQQLEKQMATGVDQNIDLPNDKVEEALHSCDGGSWINYSELDSLLKDPDARQVLGDLLQVQKSNGSKGLVYPLFNPGLVDELESELFVPSHPGTWKPKEALSFSLNQLDLNVPEQSVGFSNKDTGNPPPVFVGKSKYDTIFGYSIRANTDDGVIIKEKLTPVKITIDGVSHEAYRFVFKTSGGTTKTIFLEREGLKDLKLVGGNDYNTKAISRWNLGDDGMMRELPKEAPATQKDVDQLLARYGVKIGDKHETLTGNADYSNHSSIYNAEGIYLGEVLTNDVDLSYIESHLLSEITSVFPPFEKYQSEMKEKYGVDLKIVSEDSAPHQIIEIDYPGDNGPFHMFELTSKGKKFTIDELKDAFIPRMVEEIDASEVTDILAEHGMEITDKGVLCYTRDPQLCVSLIVNYGDNNDKMPDPIKNGWSVNMKLSPVGGKPDSISMTWTNVKTGKEESHTLNLNKIEKKYKEYLEE